MARVLYDGLVDYEDGTPATTSQMAKDVVEFLNWAAEPEMDDRKLMGWKVLAVTSVLYALSIWVKKYVFSSPSSLTLESSSLQLPWLTESPRTQTKGTNGLRSKLEKSSIILPR